MVTDPVEERVPRVTPGAPRISVDPRAEPVRAALVFRQIGASSPSERARLDPVGARCQNVYGQEPAK
ncbi:hypothetical protein [Actinoplanes sp. NPDC051494]|uniref:hypothetical protein n=1 Tax=Actinoplanes sp. NPDC051494 TaxID=3363907 RepID=UPI0037A51EAA